MYFVVQVDWGRALRCSWRGVTLSVSMPVQLEALRKQEDALKKGNPDAAAPAHKQGKNVTIAIHVTEPGAITLRLVYLVSAKASWKPSYGELP